MPVKIKYQSVQGVTMSIIKPICKLMCPPRNILDNANVSRGVTIKLIANAEIENFRSEKDFEISFISIFKKTKSSINIKKNSMKFPAYCSKTGCNFPRAIPARAEKMIKSG
jgi:hypothetical protein